MDSRYTQALFYNVFGENTYEGPGDAPGWPVFQCYAKSGQVWSSNKERGVSTITLHDLAGRETVRLQSAVEDLSLVEYDKLEEALTTWGKDIDKLERSEKHLDAKGNMLISKAPAYKGRDPTDPEDMPLNLVVQTSNDGNEFKVTLNFTEHNPSVTILVGENEWIDVVDWIYKNWNIVGGLSFLPRTEHVYQLAPYEEIDEPRYHKLTKRLGNIDFSQIVSYERTDETEAKHELACVAGVCEIE